VHGSAVVGRREKSAGLGKIVQVTQLQNVAFATECFIDAGEGLSGWLVLLARSDAEYFDLADKTTARAHANEVYGFTGK
jgi:hypothetical protein